jgi:uncharacterized protein YjbI with pentapeptide repeats
VATREHDWALTIAPDGGPFGLMGSTLKQYVIQKEEEQAHAAWFAAGRQGPGRVERSDGQLDHALVSAWDLRASLFQRIHFEKPVFFATKFEGAQFVACTFVDASFSMTKLAGAVFEDCTLTGGLFSLSRAKGLRMSRCRLDGVELERVWWEEACLEDVDAPGSNLKSAWMSGATLRRCNLRDADFSHVDPVNLRTKLAGTRFEHCDLRGAKIPEDAGAVLVDCQR